MVVGFYGSAALTSGIFLLGWAIRLRKYLRARPVRLEKVPSRMLNAVKDL